MSGSPAFFLIKYTAAPTRGVTKLSIRLDHINSIGIGQPDAVAAAHTIVEFIVGI
jgi:hypothetical protein